MTEQQSNQETVPQQRRGSIIGSLAYLTGKAVRIAFAIPLTIADMIGANQNDARSAGDMLRDNMGQKSHPKD